MRVLAAAIVALGMAAAGWFVGNGIRAERPSERYVTVKGVAERAVRADLALWSIRFLATGDDLAAVQAESRADARRVTDFLVAAGLATEGIEVQGIEVTDALANPYRSGPVSSRFVVAQSLLLRTTDVDAVAAASQRVGELVDAGVVLSAQGEAGPSYLFTRLNDVKPAMIAEATRRAREGAEHFARDSASRVGRIRRANQGLFQILPRDGAPTAREHQQIAKTVRVVSTLEFLLVD